MHQGVRAGQTLWSLVQILTVLTQEATQPVVSWVLAGKMQATSNAQEG